MIEILEKLRVVDPEEVRKIDSSDKVVGMILDTRKILLDDYPSLKVISRVGVGTDNIDFDECEKRGIKVFITPCDELSQSVAEFTVGQILTFVKRKRRMLSPMLVGIIGYGRIGKRIRSLMRARFCFYDRVLFNECSERESVLKYSDIIIISVSGNDQIIGKEELNIMKPGCILVNIARRECVDEEEVEKAIEEERLGGFISDVNPEYLIYKIEPKFINNIVITPHIASDTYEARKAMEEGAVKNLIGGLGNANL